MAENIAFILILNYFQRQVLCNTQHLKNIVRKLEICHFPTMYSTLFQELIFTFIDGAKFPMTNV